MTNFPLKFRRSLGGRLESAVWQRLACNRVWTSRILDKTGSYPSRPTVGSPYRCKIAIELVDVWVERLYLRVQRERLAPCGPVRSQESALPGAASLRSSRGEADVANFGATPGELRDASLTSCGSGLYLRCLKGNAFPLPILFHPHDCYPNICC